MISSVPPDERSDWLHRPLAVVGMDCRLPGGDGLDAFWQLIATGTSAVERMSDEKLDRELYYCKDRGQRGKTYSDIGGFVSQRELDWSLLNLDPGSAGEWDECHLNFYEVAARACRDAGLDPRNLSNRRTGVFVGHSGGSTLGGELAFGALAQQYVSLLDQIQEHSANADELKRELLDTLRQGRPTRQKGKPWVDAGFAAGLVSKAMGLDGPHMSIDAACASSLVALSLGALSIHSGQADMAIVGGASFNKSDSLILFSHAQSCSSSGSRPFDQNADGLVGSEGYVALVIKSLSRAEQDGDRIHAVINGIGMSSDGRGRSLWAPRKEGQLEAIRRAYGDSVNPSDVQMIEAHATSTQIGDATEMQALQAFYQQHVATGKSIPVGSVKSNIGHTLETAGLAGVVKSILAIQNQVIPPTINVEHLNTAIPWDDIPLHVSQQAVAWPKLPAGQPRRAAVNAFGIGGLNVHLVVQQYVPSQPESRARESVQSSSDVTLNSEITSVAVVGRGLVVPGAVDVPGFERLLDSSQSQLASTASGRIAAPDCHLGYVQDYQYDWRRHRIPPKQIAQANPLQFMLLDSAEQALGEAGLLDQEHVRSRTAVVVGSVFGGDFGNELFAGLRLPEIRKRLIELQVQRGQSREWAERFAVQYEAKFLKQFPALLDETGSFTSSTLASRLAKTFNLMGGAMAVDSGDTSGIAAINIGRQLLASGAADYVLCAGAHRALDAAAVENLRQLGRLPQPSSNPGLADCGASAVGEGVGLVVLKRLDDARRDGDKIWTTVLDCAVASDSNSASVAVRNAQQRVITSGKAPSTQVVGCAVSGDEGAATMASQSAELTGNLQCAQGVVDLIAQSLSQTDSNKYLICSHTLSGQSYALLASNDGDVAAPAGGVTASRQGAPMRQSTAEVLAKAASSPMPRVAWMFPGQGSQYTGMLRSWIQESAVAREALSEANAALVAMGQPTFESMAWSQPNRMGKDVWATQAVMLVADWTLLRVMQDSHFQVDAVCGHSFGEIPALLAAGCWDLPTALQATWLRCQAVEQNVASECGMACVLQDESSVQRMLDEGNLRLRVSHRNAPAQTVVGGLVGEIQRYATLLTTRNISHRILDVPTAFHTVQLAPAVAPFQDALGSCSLRPPRIPLLSGVGNAYIADPMLIRASLAKQLETPLDFVGMIQRLEQDGITHIVEVGPGHVLSKLVQQIAPSIMVITTDAYPADANRSLAALVEVRAEHTIGSPTKMPGGFSADPARREVASFDATQTRRTRLRASSAGGRVGQPIRPKPTASFDATDVRRDSGRSVALESTQATAEANVDVPSDSAANVADVLIDLIVEQTGYPRDIIELDWDFEADLGIDSIKKAQIFGELRESFVIESLADLQLDNFRTLQSVVAFLDNCPGKLASTHASSLQPNPPEAFHQATTVAAPSGEVAMQAAGASVPETDLAQLLIDFVVEQTGFPPEIIDLQADLEADLGIDSIKKAQLLGELREVLSIAPTSDVDPAESMMQLDQFRSLADILQILSAGVPSLAETKNHTRQEDESTHRDTVAISVQEPVHVGGFLAGGASSSAVTQMLVDFVVEQTGYPPEIVELDADLEADLGIDSIKKAQLLGELRETFGLGQNAQDGDAPASLDQLRSLQDIANLIQESNPRQVADSVEGVAQSRKFQDPVPPQDALPRNGNQAGKTSVLLPQWSTADASNPQFLDAVRSNLRSMAARIGDSADRNPATRNETSGQIDKRPISRASRELASCAGVSPASLRALERLVGDESQLRVVERQGASESGAADPTSWFAELQLPGWMNGAPAPLGLIKDASPGIHRIVVPGSNSALGIVNARGVLVALYSRESGFASMDKSDSWLDVSEIAGAPFAGIQARLRELIPNSSGWTAIVADVSTGQAISLSYRDGVLQQQPLGVGGFPVLKDIESAAPGLRIRIGVHSATSQFVIRRIGKYSTEDQVIAVPELPSMQSTKMSPAANRGELSDPTASEPLVGTDQKSERVANRYVLRMVPANQISAPGRQPSWSGSALVIGDNPVARQLESRLKSANVSTIRWAASQGAEDLKQAFDQLSANHTIPHLFLLTACDTAAALSLDADAWQNRRNAGLLGNFWLCQSWLKHVVDRNVVDDASLISVSTMGGDFGISGELYSAEGGGVGGMLKSMLIESWMQGHRSLPIKTLDTGPKQSPAEIVECIWRELAIPSYDNEVAYRDGQREVVRAIARPVPKGRTPIGQGGTWVCTGGARGITAFVAEQLASRYGLTLHLLGTSGLDDFDTRWRDLGPSQLAELKKSILRGAREVGKSPMQAWQDVEKLIEIDATLQRFAASGISAHYHVCDVASRAQVHQTLDQVRRISGGIEGVLHGAGVGKDARFDRKQSGKVNQCIGAKVDGSLNLMAATWDDPLKYFVGFGSISGRFGANGHTDYSLANEMLCKQVAWLRKQRPEVKAVGFHWHAWGDVGMATKPETKLALEMIDMQFMPAEEGLTHLINELESDSPEAEVLITDDRYYRAFYPAETMLDSPGVSTSESWAVPGGLLTRSVDENAYEIAVDPRRDPFLVEHCLDGKPLLPFVVAAEMLVEATQAAAQQRVLQLMDLEALSAVRMFHDGPQTLRVETAAGRDQTVDCQLLSRFIGRSGQQSGKHRVNFSATAVLSHTEPSCTRVELPQGVSWKRAEYPPQQAKFYVGWPLQKLKKVAVTDGGLVGQISAPALVELAGVGRDTRVWQVPSAAMDACLFAVGILAWQQIAPGVSLPVRIGRLTLGRLPRPGEALQVHVLAKESGDGSATFDFSLYGVDGAMILAAEDYQIAWLAGGQPSEDISALQREA